MELSLQLSRWQSSDLEHDFYKYSHKTGIIKMCPCKRGTKIAFTHRDMGIHWYITPKGHFKNSTDILYADINPKVLGGVVDYITAATYYDMSVAIINFDRISKEISPILQTFGCYTVNRIDYCLNLHIDELVPDCSPQQIMNLIKRSNVPSKYEEWKKYDTVAHRTKDVKSSFYLMNKAVDINAYLKYDELLDRMEKGYPHITEEMLEDSKSIIRFEVQCKRRKLYDIIERLGVKDNGEINKYRYLLQPRVCEEVISRYFSETVGCGYWYSFAKAIKKIDSYNFNIQKRNRLVEALRTVSDCKSVHKAKESCLKDGGDSFTRTLKELSDLGINPVTIPQAWGIKQIPNLLVAYNLKKYSLD